MHQAVRAHSLAVPAASTVGTGIPHPLPLQDDCRLLALPPGLLEDIVRRACCFNDAACPSHIAGSCMTLMRALLGCEGVRVQLDVTSADLKRCGRYAVRIRRMRMHAWMSACGAGLQADRSRPHACEGLSGLEWPGPVCPPALNCMLWVDPCRWSERLRGHVRGVHLKLSSEAVMPLLDFTPLLCLDGLRSLSLDQVGSSGGGDGTSFLHL